MSSTIDVQKVAQTILGLTGAHLRKREARDGSVSIVGLGGGFEGWLAVETRVAIEQSRAKVAKAVGVATEHLWTATEWPNKTDLSIGIGDDPLVVVELKVVPNNKNWRDQCDAVWNDLLPARGPKARMNAARIAMVVTLWKHYQKPRWYPGQDAAHGPRTWRDNTRRLLRRADGVAGPPCRVLGTPFKISLRPRGHEGLVMEARHGIEIEMLALDAAP